MTNENMVLRTEHLFKKYGKRTVVSDVSINVKQGEIVGLLGPNGAGKTTTFYMTTGLVEPNSGKIFLNDEDITNFPVYKRAQKGIGYLAQEASVFRKMTVEDNIIAVLEMTKFSKEEQKHKLETLIAEFNLEQVRKNIGDRLSGGERRRTEIARCLAIEPRFIMLDEPFAGVDPIAVQDIQDIVWKLKEKNIGDRLSGGERRRTEIARCLAIEPRFIMLDEPFAGVDPIAVQDIQDIVWKLKDKNIGILITDHNVDETLTITDRAYLLFEGRILFQGTSKELADNPVVREKYLGRDFELKKKTRI